MNSKCFESLTHLLCHAFVCVCVLWYDMYNVYVLYIYIPYKYIGMHIRWRCELSRKEYNMNLETDIKVERKALGKNGKHPKCACHLLKRDSHMINYNIYECAATFLLMGAFCLIWKDGSYIISIMACCSDSNLVVLSAV